MKTIRKSMLLVVFSFVLSGLSATGSAELAGPFSPELQMRSNVQLPPTPPAKLAGFVLLRGKHVTDTEGYQINGIAKGVKIEGRIDSDGRYTIIIPSNKGISPGDKIKLVLDRKGKPVIRPITIRVPEFGTMKVRNIRFKNSGSGL